MYKKIVNAFFNELKSDNLLKLPNDFYDNVRNYLKQNNENIEIDEDKKTELERIAYYIKELRKLRLNKAFFGNRDNLIEEEKKLLLLIEDINYHYNFRNNENNNGALDALDNSLDDYGVFESELNNPSMASYPKPKPINTQNDIDIVRVNTRFPEFTDGKYNYLLNKNDIITLDKKFSKILEKHSIVKKINGE
jgi:DNA replication initiation complex subunit (GINS family)